jgi:hypothetical protein
MAEKNDEKKLEDVMENYKIIREALSGLYEILNINLSDSNFYHVAAMDNLKALNENIIEILKSSTYPREIRMKLRELEFDEIEAEKNFPL